LPDERFFLDLAKVDNQENDSVCFQLELGRVTLFIKLKYFGELAGLKEHSKNIFALRIH
jgi:hypothetical protein